MSMSYPYELLELWFSLMIKTNNYEIFAIFSVTLAWALIFFVIGTETDRGIIYELAFNYNIFILPVMVFFSFKMSPHIDVRMLREIKKNKKLILPAILILSSPAIWLLTLWYSLMLKIP